LKSVVLHTKVTVNAREFHVHTGSVSEKNLILSEIFEHGKFVSSKQIVFEERDARDEASKLRFLKNKATNLHKNTIEEINMLFYIQSKIKPLKLYLPHFKLGTVLLYRNILPEAIESFKICLENKPDFIPGYIMLGKCYIGLGAYSDAVSILLKGFKLNSEYPDLANTLGVALIMNKDYQKATSILQQALKKNPEYDEANFNLGIALFRSTIDVTDQQDKSVVPPRVVRYLKSLVKQERYQANEWQNLFENTLGILSDGTLSEILTQLESLQLKLITHVKIDPIIESFYLKFMYGGRELPYTELESYENRIWALAEERNNFADFWNEMGTIHIIQCRHLFLKAVNEFERAVELNNNYSEAMKNLELIQNIKKGFLILLRAILK
jgi:tetratricopeptide (TPR) repeat protein